LNPLKHFKGRFLVKAAAFVCDSCNSRTRATIDDYVFSGFFPGSLSPNVTYLFAEEALLLGHHITHKSPGSSKKMYAHFLEEVSTEYGRVCDIKGPVLYARDSKNLVLTEWTNKCNIIYYC
jgi:hypothetical protein